MNAGSGVSTRFAPAPMGAFRKPSETETDLIFTHQGAFFKGADGPEMREAGWRRLLEQVTEEFPRESEGDAGGRGPMHGKKPSIDRVFHAFGDPSRRAIMEKLSESPISVSRLAEPLDITLAAVVQQLQVLEGSGLVQTEKVGRVRTCRMEPAGLSVVEQWIGDHRSMWKCRLDRLGDLLAEEAKTGQGAP
jgi:DNA-binding transcriptional ArsR family regulator